MNKFPIGSQWKTRGGWRAIIVGMCNGFMQVWHEPDACSWDHYVANGKSEESDCRDGDLIEPWKEPVVHEAWLTIFDDKYGGMFVKFTTDPEALRSDVYKCLACIPIKFTEGEGL